MSIRPARLFLLQDGSARPAHRLGGAGRYLDRILHFKYIASGTCAPQPQMAQAKLGQPVTADKNWVIVTP